MDDRKLLELAAKAGNVKLWRGNARRGNGLLLSCGMALWNPIERGNDTLELEIKLRLDVVAFADEWHVTKRIGGQTFSGVHADRQRATTMCAAEIGKTL